MVGDGVPSMQQVQALRLTMRVINEAMRLYPQPPVLIRRALGPDTLAGYHLPTGSDLFISVWNLHRCAPGLVTAELADPRMYQWLRPVSHACRDVSSWDALQTCGLVRQL